MGHSHQIADAAVAVVLIQFIRCGWEVSPRQRNSCSMHDFSAQQEERLLRVSVKGSVDGSWGLTHSHLNGRDFHAAAEAWLSRQPHATVVCFVRFQHLGLSDHARIYLARPGEVAALLKSTAGGGGRASLHEQHTWRPGTRAAGTTDRLPTQWRFSSHRLVELSVN